MRWEAVIGLEVHARLSTKTKLFCACPVLFGAGPNTLTCPVCLGLPGALPVVNRRAIEFAIRAALAFGCEVHRESSFDRKSCFYPDLPKGYQITQYARPLATGGAIEIDSEGGVLRVPIRRIHVEEDAAKITFDSETGRALLDFNRAGAPLVEIVTGPVIGSDADACLKTVRQTLMYLDVCDGEMEEDLFRRARPMRAEEESIDYRYMPEPDLQPLRISGAWIPEIAETRPELPRARRERFQTQYALPRRDAELLTAERPLADYFEDCVKLWNDPKTIANWVMTDLLREIGREKTPVASCPVTANNLVSLLKLIHKGEISQTMAREIFAEMYRSGSDAPTIVQEKGLAQLTDAAELRAMIEKIVDTSPSQVDKYLAGNEKVVDYFMGEVMKATMGRANPAVALEIIKQRLRR